MPREPGRIFVSYAHTDSKWLNKLQVVLAPLVSASNVVIWDDSRISPGARWRNEIRTELERASAAVLLVSQAFLASSFISTDELPPLLRAASKEGLRILWIPIGHCLYQESPLVEFQSVWDPIHPLNGLKAAARDRALVEIATAIKVAAAPPRDAAADAASKMASEAIALLLGSSDGDVAVYQDWYAIPWAQLLSKTFAIECAVSYMDTWINNAANALQSLLGREGTIRFYLPKAGSSGAARVAERFPDYDEDLIAQKIVNTREKLLALRAAAGRGTVEVLWTDIFNMYCLMMLDNSVLLVSPYDHFRNNRIQNPTFVIDLARFPGMAAWAEKEFAGFRLNAELIANE